MTKPFDLSGKIALVTGASGGLGRHFAGVLAGAGATVAVCARRMDKITETVAGIESEGGRAFGVELDVTDSGSVIRAFDLIEEDLDVGNRRRNPSRATGRATWRQVARARVSHGPWRR